MMPREGIEPSTIAYKAMASTVMLTGRFFFGGGSWIRTNDNYVMSVGLWAGLSYTAIKTWSGIQESNPYILDGSQVHKHSANAAYKIGRYMRNRTSSFGSSDRRAHQLRHIPKILAGAVGIEPTSFSVNSRAQSP